MFRSSVYSYVSFACFHLQGEGSHVASWEMRRTNLYLLFLPELEATSRSVHLSGASCAFALAFFFLCDITGICQLFFNVNLTS